MQTGSAPISDGLAAAMLRENPGYFQASLSDPWVATHQTVQYMCGLVRNSQADLIVHQAAEDAVRRFAALANPSTPAGKACCVWWYVKHVVRFVHHQALLRAWLGKADELQLLISPDVLLRMERPKGDCAVFTCLICVMLNCLGVPWDIVTLATDPREPEIFQHVYPRAVLEDGTCLPLDASHGKYPGWEVPRSRQYSKQVWNSAGEPISDSDSGYRGLHGMYGDGGIGMNGLGQDGSDPYAAMEDEILQSAYTPYSFGPNPVLTPVVSTPQTAAQIQAEAQLAGSGMNLLGQIVAPQVVYKGPGGTSLTAPAGSAAVSSSFFGSSLSTSVGSISPTILWLGALALGAMVLLPMLSKR